MVIIIFEGLPGSGKTSITKYLSKKYPFCIRIGEVIDKEGKEIPIEKHYGKEWSYFTRSDLNKLNLWKKRYTEKIVLLDRGFLSTLSHGFAREVVHKNSPFHKILKEFEKKIDPKLEGVYFIYLEQSSKNSLKRSLHPPKDIWGKIPELNATKLFYETFFLFRRNVFRINCEKLDLKKCLRNVEKIVLEIKRREKIS
ncbi:hypothetical protein GYA25_01520 [Candidatus Woesearchaeota archaeon]|nr:hypothetical protein [Candidatus Woesearchaeota archaeon]